MNESEDVGGNNDPSSPKTRGQECGCGPGSFSVSCPTRTVPTDQGLSKSRNNPIAQICLSIEDSKRSACSESRLRSPCFIVPCLRLLTTEVSALCYVPIITKRELHHFGGHAVEPNENVEGILSNLLSHIDTISSCA